MINRK